jgi:hypothetical protein
MTYIEEMGAVAAAALAFALLAGVMEGRRIRRRDFRKVGWMPWRGLQVAAFFLAMLFAVLAVKAA